MITNHIPPQALDIEESVLAACLLGHAEPLHMIFPEVFYRSAHEKIFRAIKSLSQKQEPIDLKTVYLELKETNRAEEVGGAGRLSQIIDESPLPVNIKHYCEKLQEKYALRKMIEISNKAMIRCFEDQEDASEIIESIQNEIKGIGSHSSNGVSSFADLSLEAGSRYDKLYKTSGEITGVPSGFRDIDWFTCGFQPSDFILIAARPSIGKSALASNIAKNVASRGGGVLIFSLEMSKDQMYDRHISSSSNVNLQKFRSGRFEPSDWDKINHAQTKAFGLPIYIDESSALHYSDVRRKAYSIKQQHDIKLIIVDYLQLMRGDTTGTRDREIGSISGAMKSIAKDLKVPVIVLSQLNRSLENRPNPRKRPQLADLRESGNLEQDADVVMFLYRPAVYDDTEEYQGQTEINFAKHRNGPTGKIELKWLEKTTTFHTIEKSEAIA